MKIIHTGDVHIGSAFKNLPTEQARLRGNELLEDFRNACFYARENGVAAVLIAGDLFDSNFVPKSLRRETLTAIQQAAPVCFFYVSGNHDGKMEFDEDKPDNLYLFSDSCGWKSYDLGEGIQLTGMDTRHFSFSAFSALALPKDKFHIALLHGDIYADTNSPERIPLSALTEKNIDYLALGHIHKPTLQSERLDGRGKYRYCGCFEGRGFDELGNRGVFLLDVQNGIIKEEKFLSFAKRQVTEVRVDVSACNSYFDVETLTLEALKNKRSSDLVKLVLYGRHKAELCKDPSLLARKLSERFFYVKVEDESQIFIDANAYKNDLTERGEFVREVGRYAFTEEERAEILEVGLKALNGEEIDL